MVETWTAASPFSPLDNLARPRRDARKQRKISFSTGEAMQISFQERVLTVEVLKGTCTVRSNHDRVLNWRTYTTRVDKKPAVGETPGLPRCTLSAV